MDDISTKVDPSMPTQVILPVCETLLANEAKRLSKEFVFEVYDKIAPHFSHTRCASSPCKYAPFLDIKSGRKWLILWLPSQRVPF